MTIVTRVAFCPNCFKENNPKTNQLFLVYGSSTNKFRIYRANWNGTTGYCPHILRIVKVIGENVVYEKACGICEVDMWKNNEGTISFEITNWSRGIMSILEWDQWILYKNDYDYEI